MRLFDKLTNSGCCYYRGQANATWSIKSGLARNKNIPTNVETICKIENRLNESFFNCVNNDRLKDIIPVLNEGYHNSWQYLMASQHYGLPTRLLDFSNDKYIALEFAVADLGQLDKDGAFFIYKDVDSIQRCSNDELFFNPFNNACADFFMQVPSYGTACDNQLKYQERRKLIQSSKFLYRETYKIHQCLALDDTHTYKLIKIQISKNLKRSIVDYIVEKKKIKFDLYFGKNEIDYRCAVLKSYFMELEEKKVDTFLDNVGY